MPMITTLIARTLNAFSRRKSGDSSMDKAALEASLNTLDIWLIVFGLFVAVGVVGESIAGFLHWRKSNDLQAIQSAEILRLQGELGNAKVAAATADARLLAEQRLTATERMRLARLERAVLPRNVMPQRAALVAALKGLGRINIAYLNKGEPSQLAMQVVQIFQAAGVMGRLITLPKTASVLNGSLMYAADPQGFAASQAMWNVTNMSEARIGGGASGLLPPDLAAFIPKGENCLIIGENDAALQPPDGQPGEGVDASGRPVPAPQ